MHSIRIESSGVGFKTKVYSQDTGKEITGISAIDIRIRPDDFVTATLTFINVDLEILADWENHPLKQWANRKTGRLNV